MNTKATRREFVLLLTGDRCPGCVGPDSPGPSREVGSVSRPRAPVAVWRSVRSLPDFWRLLELRMAANSATASSRRSGRRAAVQPRAGQPRWRSRRVRGVVSAVLATGAVRRRTDGPLGSPPGADSRQCRPRGVDRHGGQLSGARCRRLLVLCGALAVNGLSRFVSSGLSAALPHVVPREQVVTMNSVASATGAVAAFLGANFMLVPRALFGSGDRGQRRSSSWSSSRC